MAKGVQRKAVGSVAARRRARELRSEYEARDMALLEGAEEFLTLQERAAVAVEGIDEQIERLEAARERARRGGWEAGAVVAARMRGLQVRGVAVREDEVADRLGVDVGELRRMIGHVKASGGVGGSAAAVGRAGGGAPAGGAQRAAGGDGPGTAGPVAPTGGAQRTSGGDGPGTAGPVAPTGGAQRTSGGGEPGAQGGPGTPDNRGPAGPGAVRPVVGGAGQGGGPAAPSPGPGPVDGVSGVR